MSEKQFDNKPQFVYVTYIRTTSKELWEALTNGDFSEQYWFGYRIESEWKVGAELRVNKPENSEREGVDDCNGISGEILEYNPFEKLVYTFSINDKPEVAEKRNGPSRVTYELKQMGPMVRLRLTHENLLPEDIVSDPDKWQGINNGWPAIISSLKSLLETEEAIAY